MNLWGIGFSESGVASRFSDCVRYLEIVGPVSAE